MPGDVETPRRKEGAGGTKENTKTMVSSGLDIVFNLIRRDQFDRISFNILHSFVPTTKLHVAQARGDGFQYLVSMSARKWTGSMPLYPGGQGQKLQRHL